MGEEDLIERAENAALRLEQANKAANEILKKQEALEVYKKAEEAKRILSGKSEAGAKPVEMSSEDKIKVGAKNYFKGTALEKAFK